MSSVFSLESFVCVFVVWKILLALVCQLPFV